MSTYPVCQKFYLAFRSIIAIAWPTVVIFSAWLSGIVTPNSCSNCIISSLISDSYAPKSSKKDARSVTSAKSTPSLSTTKVFTLELIEQKLTHAIQ